MLIYVTGTIGAGKGEVVNYLVKKYDMNSYSFRRFYTEELNRRGIEVNRANMLALADELRQTKGFDYVVKTLTEEARAKNQDAVIESIRNLGEVAYVKEQKDGILLAVDAPTHIRFERINGRGSALDNRTYEQFLKDDENEMANTDPWRTNIAACIPKADFIYNNEGTLEDLHAWIDSIVPKIGL